MSYKNIKGNSGFLTILRAHISQVLFSIHWHFVHLVYTLLLLCNNNDLYMVCCLALYRRFQSSRAIGSRTLLGFLSPLHFPKGKGSLEFYIPYFKIIKIDLLLFLNRREKKYLMRIPQKKIRGFGSPSTKVFEFYNLYGVWGVPRDDASRI